MRDFVVPEHDRVEAVGPTHEVLLGNGGNVVVDNVEVGEVCDMLTVARRNRRIRLRARRLLPKPRKLSSHTLEMLLEK